jgi:hypothetical protein
MKYYLGKIGEINGDMEYGDKYLFATRGSPERYSDRVTRDWRGSTKADWDEEMCGYWSDSAIISNAGWREIPKEDFDVLRKYIAVL